LGEYYSASTDAEPFTVSEPDIAILVANCIDNTIRIAISDICISDSECGWHCVSKSNAACPCAESLPEPTTSAPLTLTS